MDMVIVQMNEFKKLKKIENALNKSLLLRGVEFYVNTEISN